MENSDGENDEAENEMVFLKKKVRWKLFFCHNLNILSLNYIIKVDLDILFSMFNLTICYMNRFWKTLEWVYQAPFLFMGMKKIPLYLILRENYSRSYKISM